MALSTKQGGHAGPENTKQPVEGGVPPTGFSDPTDGGHAKFENCAEYPGTGRGAF